MVHLDDFKNRYSTPGEHRLRFGLTLGFDTTGSIPIYPASVDDFYIEMYDWYVWGRPGVVPIEANTGEMLNNPERFIQALDERQQWGQFFNKYSRHEKIIFMWSLQARSSKSCLFPLTDGTCGERNDFGTWSAHAFKDFLDLLPQRDPVFAQRQHGLFQFSYVPQHWHSKTCQ